MSSPKKSYRVYCFDAANRNVGVDWIEAASDAEAVALVQQGEPHTKCEIWDGRRLVATLEIQRKQASAE